MVTPYVSDAVIRRLPRYKRFLRSLKLKGQEKTSSKELAQIMDLTASQIRQDLNHFGGFGQQGYGYNVSDLERQIDKILGTDKTYTMGFIGCGRLGEALANYIRNNEPHFKVTALCDIRPDMQGTEIAGAKVMGQSEFDEFVKKNPIDIMVLTVPADQIPSVERICVEANVKGVWNFGLVEISLPGIPVSNMHLSESLESLVYYINHPD